MRKKALTIDKAYNIIEKYYMETDKQILVDILMEAFTFNKDGNVDPKKLIEQLEMIDDNYEYKIVPEGKASDILFKGE